MNNLSMQRIQAASLGGRRGFAGRTFLLATASTLSIWPAQAQESASSDTVLQEIVIEGTGVTETKGYVAKSSRVGTKTETPLEKVPQSITVVTREQMNDQQVTSVAESLRYTAGVFSDYRGASNVRDEVFLRGYYYAPRYLDGLLFATAELGQIDPYLLQSVEVLRGPSSVLFGQANPGGVINMTSKLPTDVPLREVTFGFGTDNYYRAGFDVSDALTDTMRYRIVATGLSTDLQEDFTEQSRIAVAPSITWEPDAGTSLTVSAMYQRDPDVGYRNFLEKAGTIDRTPYGRVPTDFFVSDPDYEDFTREQASIGYQFEHEINDTLTFHQSARYTRVDEEQHTLVWNYLDPDGKTVYRTASGGREVVDQFVIDNNLELNAVTGPVNHTVLAGIDFRYRQRDYQWGRNSGVPSIDWTNPVYGNLGTITLTPSDDTATTARQVGVYLQDQIEIGRLNLLLGGRHDWASTDITDNLNGGDSSYDDHAFSYRAGAVYNFDSGISPYVSYSTSFEPVIQTAPAGADPFKPTTARQFEAGVRYAPDWSDFQITASYFDIHQNNLVGTMWEQDSSGDWISVSKQMGKTQSRGFELHGQANLTDEFSLLASYTYVKTEVLTSVDPTLIGNAMYRAPPPHSASLWGKYEFLDGAAEGLGIGLGVRYEGENWGNEANTFKVPSVTLFDAALSYDFGARNPNLKGLSLQINAKNLADKTYVSSCASTYACWYGARRSVVGTLKYTW